MPRRLLFSTQQQQEQQQRGGGRNNTAAEYVDVSTVADDDDDEHDDDIHLSGGDNNASTTSTPRNLDLEEEAAAAVAAAVVVGGGGAKGRRRRTPFSTSLGNSERSGSNSAETRGLVVDTTTSTSPMIRTGPTATTTTTRRSSSLSPIPPAAQQHQQNLNRSSFRDGGTQPQYSRLSTSTTTTTPLSSMFDLQQQRSSIKKLVDKNSNHSRNENTTAILDPGHDDDDDDDTTATEHHVLRRNNASPHYNNNRASGRGGVVYAATTLASGSVRTDHNNNNKVVQLDAMFSHTYEPDESEIWRAYTAQVHYRNRHEWWTVEQESSVKRWILTFIIGVIQAIIATACNFVARYLSSLKYDAVHVYLYPQQQFVQDNNDDDDDVASSTGWLVGGGIMTGGNNNHHHYDPTNAASSSNPPSLWMAFGIYLLYQTLFGIIASLFVWYEPSSGGSGIPEVKCFLNGIDMPRLLSLRTLLCKLVGITFSVAAGFPIGMEGPMVHSGACVGAIVCEGGQRSKSRSSQQHHQRPTNRNNNTNRSSFWWNQCLQQCCCSCQRHHSTTTTTTSPRNHTDMEEMNSYPGSSSSSTASNINYTTKTTPTSSSLLSGATFGDFRNDREKRDFVACGAAAGVCSAFGSPIGGVLFSLEEASSFFSIKLTWRAFFCAMTSLATVFWIRNADSLWGQANMDRLFSLGDFNSGEASSFSIWELSLFVIVGCLGGMIGAVFNAANEHITLWRMRRINHSKLRRFLEAVFVCMLVTTVSFLMPLLWGKCTDLPTDMQDWTNQEKKLVESLVPFRCVPGKEYNEVASLIFTEADTAIKQLLHFRESGALAGDTRTFSSGALFVFFVPYIITAAITYGIAVPSGLFVPSLLSGAAFGRLVGHLLHRLDPTNGLFADSGTYALIGAAAVLGGMARMTISLTVILLEATGDMQYVLPLMLAVMAARFTGNVFNEGLYDIHIHLKKIPFLEPDVAAIAERYEIVAGQAMSTDVKCLRPVERVGVVYDLLRACNHGTFPIVDTASGGTLYGTASRHVLCTLLQRKAFGPPHVLDDLDDSPHHQQQQQLGPVRLSPLVNWETIERAYPNYPTIHDVHELSVMDRASWLDLRPYANTAPYTVNETASIQRTYRLFRTMGLRFLCVVNHNNQVVGCITRKDLLPASLRDSLVRRREGNNNTPLSDAGHRHFQIS